MAKSQETVEQPSNGTTGLGDISVIRNILFGQQTAEFQSSFDAFKSRLDAKDLEQDERFTRLEAHFKNQIENLTANMNQKIQQLEGQLKNTQQMLSDKIAATSKQDKADIGHLLQQIGKKLTD
jgi:hypothetical protein